MLPSKQHPSLYIIFEKDGKQSIKKVFPCAFGGDKEHMTTQNIFGYNIHFGFDKNNFDSFIKKLERDKNKTIDEMEYYFSRCMVYQPNDETGREDTKENMDKLRDYLFRNNSIRLGITFFKQEKSIVGYMINDIAPYIKMNNFFDRKIEGVTGETNLHPYHFQYSTKYYEANCIFVGGHSIGYVLPS